MKRNDSGSGRPFRQSSYDKAISMLAKRDLSQHELRRKLENAGYVGAALDTALSRLVQRHEQDDARFAATVLRNRVRQGYGPLRISTELKTHGLMETAIQQLLDEAEVDWTALASRQLRRRYGDQMCADCAESARRSRFLLRRGFPSFIVREAIQVTGSVADKEN